MAGNCKGCRSSYYCDLVMDEKTDGCPCKICLVKTQCQEQCEQFKDVYFVHFGFYPGAGKGW